MVATVREPIDYPSESSVFTFAAVLLELVQTAYYVWVEIRGGGAFRAV